MFVGLTLNLPLFFSAFFEEARMKFKNGISHNIMSKVYEMYIILKAIDLTLECNYQKLNQTINYDRIFFILSVFLPPPQVLKYAMNKIFLFDPIFYHFFFVNLIVYIQFSCK